MPTSTITPPRSGTRIKEVKKGFGTALKLAGISGLVWHDLRATFGTRLGERGFDAFTIAALMGHSQIIARRATPKLENHA